MAEAFIGEIRMAGFNFAPRGWALCQGQLLSIAQNTAVFSILGTNYGGDGRVTFGLPDLRGRIPLGTGQGPGLTPRTLGELAGDEGIMLTSDQVPPHNHSFMANSQNPGNPSPALPGGSVLAKPSSAAYVSGATPVPMMVNALNLVGNSAPHENRQPTLCLNFIICLEGIFPSRN